ncbi:hypothetical protein QBD01_003738 [Ochrobactrum sp. 19YEA23]|nr:hypothetical protein [Ochrobactrum sp. 19YEA23]
MTCETCTELLNEALNLVVRARQMDAIDRRNNALKASKEPEKWEASGRFDDYVERHNIDNEHAPMATRSGTLHLWVLDQYERDLHEWEGKARKHLMKVDHSSRAALRERE